MLFAEDLKAVWQKARHTWIATAIASPLKLQSTKKVGYAREHKLPILQGLYV
jgi:hypothetical protein